MLSVHSRTDRATAMTYDWIFREVTVHDGAGAPGFVADVAVEGGRIAAVGAVAGTGRNVVDGAGLALSPGFIDVHTHDDFAAIAYKDMAFKTAGGVTTCVVGNCGMGAAPYAAASRLAQMFNPNARLPEWDGYSGYLALLDKEPAATNIATLIGHGTARAAVMGVSAAAPTAQQMADMKDVVKEGLDAGAVGLSTGLIYEPGRYATTDEIIELTSVLRGSGALYATHMRDEGLGLLASVDEAIRIGEAAGVGVQISHHKAAGKAAWGLVTQSLERIDAAQRRGLDVHADQYPYTAGSTMLRAVAADGRLGGDDGGLGSLTPDDVVIASTRSHQDWEGTKISALCERFGLPLDATLARILDEEPGATVVLHSMSEEDVRTVMRHPSTMIGSDGIPTLEGKPHPRLYGTFARVLGHYARDLRILSLPDAIYRMTGFPAAKFGFADRGVIAPGKCADLVLFDPATIIDRGTFENPKQAPAGVELVLVNGEAVFRDGRVTEARPGKALRRGVN
jgi:N-acyl-D-amino-acid deacylase